MSFETKQSAERWLERQVPAIRDGTAPTLADRALTVAGYLDQWLESAENADGDPWRPCTRQSYGRDVRLYLRPVLGRYKLAELRPHRIKGLWVRMRDAGKSVHTIRAAYATLNSALNVAVAEQRISWNPCIAAKTRKPPPPQRDALTTDQVSMFLAHARERKPHLVVAFWAAGWRGLRRGEVMGARWSDLDLDTGVLHVRRNVTEAGGDCTTDCAPDCQGGGIHVGKPKTQHGERTVSIGPQLAAVLRAHRRDQAERRLAAGPAWEDHDLIFPGSDGRWLGPWHLTQGFKRLAKEVGLPEKFHLHSLRHTAASVMFLAEERYEVVADQIGHSDPGFTLRTYGHVYQQQRDAAAEASERLYSADSGTSVSPL
jgi:integrase